MASESSSELPPEWGLVPPKPDPSLVLPGDAIGRELDRIDIPSLDVPISRIIRDTPLAFRPDVEIIELTTKFDNTPLQRATIMGGAVVRNLSLIIPDDDLNGFADLLIQPNRASKGEPAQLVTKILGDETETAPMPLLILPDELRGGLDIKSADSTTVDLSVTCSSWFSSPRKPTSRPTAWALTTLKAGGASEEKKGKKNENEMLERSEMEEFVLSGDIDAVGMPEEQKCKEDETEYKTKQPNGNMTPFSDELYTQTKDDKDDEVKDGREDDEDQPAREKLKLNAEEFGLKGQPLEELFPSIEEFNLKNLPVENLKLTYSEVKKNFLFKPGLTLGAEITATTEAKNKASRDKTEGDKPEYGKARGESDGDHDTGSGDENTAKLNKFQTTATESGRWR
ncbi:hypothetical protein FGLOB1_1785 [Fusarium globosum]|uniref:Uncharacterized protein n=1 Tax=Fusarium globosum TaxID=78864 RepID=A0A8H5YV69_9HYPO|nr:hypothetical protein FGLOB1_1785 [Fusarium globosum]